MGALDFAGDRDRGFHERRRRRRAIPVAMPDHDEHPRRNRFHKLEQADLWVVLVDRQPGLTRDRLYGVAEWRSREMSVVDTAGLELSPEASSASAIEAQTRVAIEEAQVIVVLLDIRGGSAPSPHPSPAHMDPASARGPQRGHPGWAGWQS